MQYDKNRHLAKQFCLLKPGNPPWPPLHSVLSLNRCPHQSSSNEGTTKATCTCPDIASFSFRAKESSKTKLNFNYPAEQELTANVSWVCGCQIAALQVKRVLGSLYANPSPWFPTSLTCPCAFESKHRGPRQN